MTSNPMMNFFSEFRLPLNRGNENIRTFLANHFEKFNSALTTLLSNISDQQLYSMLEKNKEIVEEFSTTILTVLEKHHQGNILQAYQAFEEQISKIEDQLVSSDIRGRGVLNRFYRIRPDGGSKRKDLFHIPFDLATKAGAYRYSIAGVPSLYLSTDIPLCWFESNLPNQFYWSEFIVAQQADNIPLIDFTGTPFRSATNAHQLSTPSALNSEPTNEFTAKMITTYPLMSACSLSVIDKRDKFIPEFIIPQMLLGWVRKSSKYRGIAYFSSSVNTETRIHRAFNVVLPPVTVHDTGYCEKLKHEFKLSAPQKVDVSSIFNSLNESSLQIREAQKKIEIIYRKFGFEPLKNVLLQCEIFFQTYQQLSNSKTTDLKFPYQCVNLLHDTLRQFTSLKFSHNGFMADEQKSEAAWGESWIEIKKIVAALDEFQNVEWRHFRSTDNNEVFCFIDDDSCDLSESV